MLEYWNTGVLGYWEIGIWVIVTFLFTGIK
jgi:hypothetical protein